MKEPFYEKREKLKVKILELIPDIQVFAIGSNSNNDIDCILVSKKLHKVNELIEWATEHFGKRVSISPLLPIMWKNKIWSHKIAVMLYKGVDYLIGEGYYAKEISFQELRKLVKRSSYEFLNMVLKERGKGLSDSKVIELLSQEVALLAEGGNDGLDDSDCEAEQ